MRINNLFIENFRSIRQLELTDLGDTVVIAGSNGCGKTQIFNSIRLFKSTYGGYQPNEISQWWGEFNINLSRPNKDVIRIFGNPDEPIRIIATIDLTEDELTFLKVNAEQLIRSRIWREVAPNQESTYLKGGPAAAQLQRTYGPEIESRTKDELEALETFLSDKMLEASIEIAPDLRSNIRSNPALELLFSTYQPERLGIIDYHGAQRNYAREQLGGINLNIDSSDERSQQHALYNWQKKYSNIKSELASGYVRQIIAEKSGNAEPRDLSLNETLQELFARFFPGKEFLGPVPGRDGTLDFPVKLANGRTHDIDDLSSGEKELLFGYLRLRNNSPKNSILLIDEPELHLNPALLYGLPEFYHRHIGHRMGNQLWLTTHSDALLREAVGQPGISVFHMQPSDTCEINANQLIPIDVGAPLEKAIVDLVGDLAVYKPGAKVVIFEGEASHDDGKDLGFDVRMTSTLFPELNKKVNPISAGSKSRVETLHYLLNQASKAGHTGTRFFSIVDKDADRFEKKENAFQWDRYHIENYLLEPEYIFLVLQDLGEATGDFDSVQEIRLRLHECAGETLNALVRHELQKFANSTLVSTIKTNIPRNTKKYYEEIHKAALDSQDRLKQALKDDLSEDNLNMKEKFIRNRFAEDLEGEEWLSSFRGRDILKCFVNKHSSVKYTIFRNLILARMCNAGFKPPGMSRVIRQILDA